MELDLLRQGYTTGRPTVTARYDLIAECDGRFYRVQVKTGRIDPRNNTLKASFVVPYTPDEVDVIAIVNLDTDAVYYVKATDLVPGVTNVTIRFTEASRETTGFLAEDVSEFPGA